MKLHLGDKDNFCIYNSGLNTWLEMMLYKWLCNRRKFNQEITVRPKDFAKLIRKNCPDRSISDRHPARVLQSIAEVGLIDIVSKGFGEVTVIVKPLREFVRQKSPMRSNMSEEDKIQDADTERDKKALEPEKGISQQQQIAAANKLLLEVDIKYDRATLPKIAAFGIEAIESAIEVYKIRSITSKIHNPPGWLRQCLRCRWYEDFKAQVTPKTEIFKFRELGKYLLDTLGTLPTLEYQ